MAIPSRNSIQSQIERQNSTLLRQGKVEGNQFDAIRERHLWSVYNFTSGYAGSAISATGVLAAREYDVFVQVSGANGQGLPAGFDMTDNDTNSPGARRIADDHNWIIKEIGVSILPSKQAVIAASNGAMIEGQMGPIECDLILGNSQLSIKYLTNTVPIAPMSQLAQAGGPMVHGPSLLDYAGNYALTATQITGGQGELPARQPSWSQNTGPICAMPKLRRRFDIPIYLPSKITFNFKFCFARPVQLLLPAQGGRGGFRCRLDLYGWETFKKQG